MLLVCAGVGLAACGGGSTIIPAATPPTTTPPPAVVPPTTTPPPAIIPVVDSFAEIQASHSELAALAQDTFDAEGLTTWAEVPTTTTATYLGTIELSQQGAAQMAGQMELDADLADNTVSGTASGFYTSAADPMTGTLEISNGTVNRGASTTDPAISAELSGTLAEGTRSLDMTGTFGADFVGDGYTYIVGGGDITGEVTENGTLVGSEDYTAEIVTNRQ